MDTEGSLKEGTKDNNLPVINMEPKRDYFPIPFLSKRPSQGFHDVFPERVSCKFVYGGSALGRMTVLPVSKVLRLHPAR